MLILHANIMLVNNRDNLPGGATGQLRYQTRNKFGAVLMACKPISLVAYNAERLFLQWLDANRAQLYQLHGKQLREYGFWLVTRSYSAPSASINAWLNAKTQISISAKAKASMLGNLGQKLSYTDSDQDSGWTHYISKTDKGITLFIDGLFVSSWDWKLEGLKLSLPKIGNAEESPHERHGEFQRRRMSSMQLDVDQSWSSKENRANEKDRRRSHDTSAQPITRKPSEMKPGQKTVSRAEYAPIPNPPLRNHHDNSNLHVPLRSRHSSSQRATWYSAHDTTEGGQQEQEHEAKDHDDSRSNHSHQTERPSRDNTAEARQFSGETNVNRESHNGNRSSRDFSSSMPPSIDVQGVDPSVLKDLGINHTLSRTQSMHSQLRQESLPRSPISSRVPSLRHESRRLSLEQSSEH